MKEGRKIQGGNGSGGLEGEGREGTWRGSRLEKGGGKKGYRGGEGEGDK